MDTYFNKLSQDEQRFNKIKYLSFKTIKIINIIYSFYRIFIINKLLSDDLFKEYHDDFKHKYTQYIKSNKKQDEKQKFIDLYKSYFDKYTKVIII